MAEPEKAEALGPDTLRLPPEAARKLGLSPGARLEVAVGRGGVELRPGIHSLAKVYLEPSSRCNLFCRTCIRRTWSEPQGDMAPPVFQKLLEDLRRFPHLSTVMLGGFGEPTMHPGLLSMVRGLKKLKIRAEMVSNGTLLDERLSAGLLEGGLDRLWISLDGAEDSSFEHIRKGARFKDVVQNLKRLREMNEKSSRRIGIGIAFVLTRKNLSGLKDIGRLAKKVGADRVSISNVIPYSPQMESQLVCDQALTLGTFASMPGKLEIDLPRLDINAETQEALWRLAAGAGSLSLMGSPIGARVDECRFIRERSLCVRWDGKVAPCMGLLHSHEIHFHGYRRMNSCHFVGDLAQQDLWDIWSADGYAAFRDKVAAFDFSPCHLCGGCGMAEDNKEDCTGNKFPATCGGCLWAQGIIQCP